MVKDPAIETLDRLIEGLTVMKEAFDQIWSIQKMQSKMILDLQARVEKLEKVQQVINDNQEQPF